MAGIEAPNFESPRESLRRQTRENLRFLQGNVGLNNEPWITKAPKLENWAAVFRYKNRWTDWEIVTRKENGRYSVRVKKWTDLPNWRKWWRTQKNGAKETFTFTANNKDTFNQQLWAVLDKTIWRSRDRLPNTWWKVYGLLNTTPTTRETSGNSRRTDVSRRIDTADNRTNLRSKPIDLNYAEKNKEKKVSINFPDNHLSVEWRITRCLRWTSVTDAVEDRYWIPRWLLMALMAQEWWGDPTVINQSRWWKCDWWAGLIHMQAANAADYGLDTIPRSTNAMADFQHWKRLQKAKADNRDDLKALSRLDDRFNPVLSVDASARFLLDKYNNLPQSQRWVDRWLHAVNKYAGRWMSDYGYSVVVFRTTINSIRWKSMPTFSREIEKVKKWQVPARVNQAWEKTTLCVDRTKNAIKNLNIKLDGKPVTYSEYLAYQKWQCDNYWLADYSKYDRTHPYRG